VYGASLPTDHTSLLTINLSRMKSSGGIVFARNNYFRPDDDDEEVEKEEPSALVPADPTSLLRPNGHEDPPSPRTLLACSTWIPSSTTMVTVACLLPLLASQLMKLWCLLQLLASQLMKLPCLLQLLAS
jgi:hypothetical protein